MAGPLTLPFPDGRTSSISPEAQLCPESIDRQASMVRSAFVDPVPEPYNVSRTSSRASPKPGFQPSRYGLSDRKIGSFPELEQDANGPDTDLLKMLAAFAQAPCGS